MKLLPGSLGGRLILLVLATLVVGQVATVVLFLENRRSAVETAARDQILSRAAAVVRLVDDTPADMHPRILEAASSSRLFYSIDPDPVVAAPGAGLDGTTAALLAEIFGAGREVRAEIRGPAEIRGERWREGRDRRHDDDDDHGRAAADGERPDGRMMAADEDGPDAGPPPRRLSRGEFRRLRLPTAALSVRLAGGAWLNAEIVLPSPALFAWPALVNTGLVAALMVLVLAVSLRRVTRPLRRLAEAADRLGRGETVPPLPEEGPDEVRRTTHAFNAMQDRVRRFVDDRTRMLAAISHDLRTPLTALRLRAEFVDDPEIRDKIVDTVDEMSRMTEATLSFARDEAAGEEARPTDLGALVRAVADDFADLGADVAVDAPDRTDLVVRPVSLRRALRNLVENAVRYGERARVRLEARPDEILIAVDDDGPGIPPDRLDDVFEPFVRLETSRSADTGGVGLGLATARSIVRAHGGDLTLANRDGGGLTATIRLPKGR